MPALPPRRLAAFCVLALSTAATAHAQTEGPPQPTQFQAKVEDPLLAPVPRPPTQLSSWEQARQLLLQRSTDLRSAQAGLERAEGRWRQSLSSLLPNARISAGVGYDLLHPETPTLVTGTPVGGAATEDRRPTAPLGGATISLTQPVIDVSAWRGLSSSAANQRSAEATFQDTNRRVTQSLARSLVAIVAAERAAEINRLGLRQALERAALTERTFQLGAATQLDVTRVRQDVAVARAAVIAGDEQLRRTREALGIAIGLDGEVGVKEGFALDGLVDEVQKLCRPLQKGEARSDLIAQQEQVRSAAESRRQASAGYLPTIGITSNASAFTTEPGPGRVSVWSIGATLSIPLWEGGFRGGLVSERSGAERQAQEAAEAARRSITVEISRARRGDEVAKELMTAAQDARALAQRTDELTRRSFEIGRATSLELVQSAGVLRQAELTLALREFEFVQARLDAFLTEAQCDG